MTGGVTGCKEVEHLCGVSRMDGSTSQALRKGDPVRGETEYGACRLVRDEKGVVEMRRSCRAWRPWVGAGL